MMRRLSLLFGLVVVLALSGGCVVVAEEPRGGGGGGATSNPGMTSSLEVINRASQSVMYIYFSEASKSSWESDMLPPDQTLNPGESVTLRCTPGYWDVKCVMQSGPPIIHYNLNLDGAYTLTITDQ